MAGAATDGLRAAQGRSRAPREHGIPGDVTLDADISGLSLLDYMLSVMRNPGIDPARRDRMAIAGAPFCH